MDSSNTGNTKKEVWKYIQDFPGYAVSNHGRVMAVDNYRTILTHNIDKGGYHRVHLSRCGVSTMVLVGRIVLEAFGKKVESIETMAVGYKDGDKNNLNLENLEWKPKKALNKRPVTCVETGEEFESILDASKQKGISYDGIRGVLNGRQKLAGGFSWVYLK